jgi:hypothetical protein
VQYSDFQTPIFSVKGLVVIVIVIVVTIISTATATATAGYWNRGGRCLKLLISHGGE